jgi:hypothetical protein
MRISGNNRRACFAALLHQTHLTQIETTLQLFHTSVTIQTVGSQDRTNVAFESWLIGHSTTTGRARNRENERDPERCGDSFRYAWNSNCRHRTIPSE